MIYSALDSTSHTLSIARASKMSEPSQPKPPCQHKRTQVIAKDNDAQYVECLDCGEILEVGELPAGEGSGESLSDA
jgi:hypothetical protein